MIRACLDVLLDLLLKVRYLTTKEIDLTDGEELGEKVVSALLPSVRGSRVGVECFAFSSNEKGKSWSRMASCGAPLIETVANLQFFLKMSIGILGRFAIEGACLHHGY